MSQKKHYTVEVLPEAYRRIFEFDQFNEMQSKCLPILWHSSDSLVVAAPTGSGKTVLLELAICRAVEDYGSEALAVYIAPTRCLVQQKVSEWRERFAALRLKVTEVTGDLNEVCDAGNGDMSTNLICTTPEKWDTELRLGAGYTWLSSRKVSVYLIDEVHMVGEPDRGPILEAVLTRTIVRCMPQSLLPRFVAISATIANPNDIGQWLGRNTPWHGYSFGERARTIPIEASVKGVYCPPDRSPFHFDANLNYKLPSLLREVLPANKSAIIFVSSRAATVICARCLVNKQSWARSSSREELRRVARFCKDKKLSDYLEHGVGFHNAGLSSEDRSLVEKTFNQGDLRVLVCTSTLAMGVNLPAYLVVVRGTTMITGGICGQYSAARIHQMIGRAGRPGLEGSGKAIIMTTSNHVARYEDILQGKQDTVESYLQRDLVRHVNREIVHKSIRSLPDVVAWLKSTFFFVRLTQNPKRYLPIGQPIEGLDDYIAEQCQYALSSLFTVGLIEKSDSRINSTELGRIFTRFYISFSGFEAFVQELHNVPDDGLSTERLLHIIVQCPDFSGVQVRSNERALLRQLNSRVRYKVAAKPGQWKNKEKIFLLLQSNLDGIEITDIGLRIDRSSVLKLARRVCRCLLESLLCLHRQKRLSERLEVPAAINSYRTIRNIALLAKALECGLWHDSEYCLQQLADIGPKRGTLLMLNGYTSFRTLRDADPNSIEMVTKTLPPFGSRLKKRAEDNFPRYLLEVVGYSNRLEITMSMANHQVNAVRAAAILLVGNPDIGIVFLRKVIRQEMVAIGGLSLHVEVSLNWNRLNVHLINETLAGVDVCVSVSNLGADGKRSAITGNDPENLSNTPKTPSIASTRSPSAMAVFGGQPHARTMSPQSPKKAENGWEVPEVNRWAVEMLLIHSQYEKRQMCCTTHIAHDEIVAVVEDALTLLNLNTENENNKVSSRADPSMEYKNVTDNSGSGPVDDSGLPFVLMPVVDNGNKFARSDQREENVSSNYHTQGNVTENVESERSLTPDDLFDNIPSPKMLNDSDAHRRNNVSQAHHDPTNTGASAKQRTQKSAGRKRKKIASQISDATQLSANNNLVTHKRRTRSVEKSSVNTKRATGLMPVPNCNTATITSVGLSPSAGGLEIDLTHPVSSNGADKPPRKLGSTKFRQPYARLVTEGGNTSFESKTPTNLDTLLASFSFPLQTQGNENALQISRAAVLQRILNLIQDSEEFCNN